MKGRDCSKVCGKRSAEEIGVVDPSYTQQALSQRLFRLHESLGKLSLRSSGILCKHAVSSYVQVLAQLGVSYSYTLHETGEFYPRGTRLLFTPG